jgi:hypothetical protein
MSQLNDLRDSANPDTLMTVVFGAHMHGESDRIAPVRSRMEEIITMIGDMDGSRRDLFDVRLASLKRVISTVGGPQSQWKITRERPLALEGMRLVGDDYRVALASFGVWGGVQSW